MVSAATLMLLVSLTVWLFTYTILHDLWVQLFTVAFNVGGNFQALGVLYSMWEYAPAAFFISTLFWYLVQAQRRSFTA